MVGLLEDDRLEEDVKLSELFVDWLLEDDGLEEDDVLVAGIVDSSSSSSVTSIMFFIGLGTFSNISTSSSSKSASFSNGRSGAGIVSSEFFSVSRGVLADEGGAVST